MRRIMVAVDWSDGSVVAVRRAALLAHQEEAALHILHVMPQGAKSDRVIAAQDRMHSFESGGFLGHPVADGISTAIRFGWPAAVILDEARRKKVATIVLGRNPPAGRRPSFSGIAQKLLRDGRVPVLVATNPTIEPYRRLLVAVDSDRMTDEMALAFAMPAVESIHVVHAFHAPFEAFLPREEVLAFVRLEEREDLDRAMREVRERFPGVTVPVHADLKEGEVVPVLARALSELAPDLLVIGNHGRTGISRMFHGSFADAILETLAFDTLIAAPRRW